MADDTETLELPNGDVVEPGDLLLYNEYPYRYVPYDGEEYAFELVPLYWGDSELDVPFPNREALSEQWGPGSEGTMTEAEWRAWLDEARTDDRFGDDELDAIARELPVEAPRGPLASLRRLLGL